MTRAPRLFGTRLACIPGLLVGWCLLLGCGGGRPFYEKPVPLTQENRELYARTNLEQARALLAEGRLDHAASRARRGLGYEPDNVQLLRLQAEILTAQGRGEDAKKHRARANALQPPLPAPPDAVHPEAGDATAAILLLPPSPKHGESRAQAGRVPDRWPKGAEAETLVRRISTRLPDARILLIDAEQHPAETIPDATAFLDREAPRGALSIRVERAYCASSVKDGRFAVVWLRVAAGMPGRDAEPVAPHLVRATLELPSYAKNDRNSGDECKAAAIAVAFERALELQRIRATLSGEEPEASEGYAAATTRALFPVLAWRVAEELGRGRRYLALGELAHAQQHFERAIEIDPADAAAVAFLDEVNRSLELARHLAKGGDASRVDPQLSASQRVGMEAQLAYETQRRSEMLSALAVLYETRNAPTPGAVANMRPVEVHDLSATAVALAMPRVPDDRAVVGKTLLAPDGSVLARYYFATDSLTPVLREDDANGDGQPDRWVGYEDGLVREVWEAGERAAKQPTLHVVYSPGGGAIERIELDHSGNGEVDRVFVYAAGVLQDEAWDTNGDGSFDRFQQFDASGSLTMREEDVNGDEQIDVRTAYTNGRIVRREILNSELLSEFQ